VKFGLIYSFQAPPGSGASHPELWKDALRQAELAEKLGYDSIGLVEHHFVDDGFNPSLFASAAAIAARTERIRIGTSCYLLPLHHPIETAENAAVVDNISNGRLFMGVAAAYRDEEFNGFGLDRGDRGPRMDEYLEILRGAWTKDAFSFKGKFYSCENLSVTPKPVQRPIPLWFGASGDAGLKRAARQGLPLVGSNRHHISELEQFYGRYRRYLSEFGNRVDEVPLLRNAYVADTDERAVEESAGAHMALLAGAYGKWSKWRPILDDKGRAPDDPAFASFESHREKVIIGSPRSAADQVEMYSKRLGVNNILCWTALPGLAGNKVEASITLFAKEVIPSFR
jgi:alkanesulfonate monooxygenase SsuD/methylene tetrahydromethanopterin reductase-like flavin-dependent oxidoreductase (luciferase family)